MSRNRHHRVARRGLAAALLLAVALVGGACAPETSGSTTPIPGTSEQQRSLSLRTAPISLWLLRSWNSAEVH